MRYSKFLVDHSVATQQAPNSRSFMDVRREIRGFDNVLTWFSALRTCLAASGAGFHEIGHPAAAFERETSSRFLVLGQDLWKEHEKAFKALSKGLFDAFRDLERLKNGRTKAVLRPEPC